MLREFHRAVHRGIDRPIHRAASRLSSDAFNPNSISSILQNFRSFSYEPTTLDSLPVLSSSVGTLAVPRGQRCVLFDGNNDYATLGTRLTTSSISSITFCGWIKSTQAGFITIAGEFAGWEVQIGPSGNLRIVLSADAMFTTYKEYNSTTAVNTGTWVHIAFSFVGGILTVYIDGSEATVTKTRDDTVTTLVNSASNFEIGRQGSVGILHFTGKMLDLRVYSNAKSDAEIAAIYNQHLMPDTIDRTGALGIWPMQEESGTTHYDISGNARNLTATNITQATYHATDVGVIYLFANELGYTQSANVIIPRNEADISKDAAGGTLQFAGPIALSGVMEVPCVTVTGTEYLALAHLTGSETVLSSVGTSTPSVVAGQINLTAGTISSIVLSDGTNLPLQEGPGTGNTNRTCHDISVNARHATLTNGTVATMWAARLNTVEDHCVNYGGNIAANGSFVPGRIGSSLDAAGNAKTLAAGEHRNPYSRILPNNWSAPSLVNIGSTSADKYAPTDMAGIQAESTADTRFASEKAYLAFRTAQTGTDKTNSEGYVL